MKKIISLFQRNYNGDRLVRNEVVPGAEWVLAGEGGATRKWDGTCCLVRDGKLYKRYDLPLKREFANKKKHGYAGPWADTMYEAPPALWERAEPYPDQASGHWPGWLPVGDGPEDRWHREAWETFKQHPPSYCGDGTYELCGPKIQGNPEQCGPGHVLLPHGWEVLHYVPRDFDGIREWLRTHNVEGIVWHHPDGRMVKIKAKDFGLKRGQGVAP